MKFSGVKSSFWSIRLNFMLILVLVLVLVLISKAVSDGVRRKVKWRKKNKEEEGERERTHPFAVFLFCSVLFFFLAVHIVLRRPTN